MAGLTINFYDVGYGSCTHIITPNNKHILIDIGSLDDKSISKYLKNTLGVSSVEMLHITHT